MDGSKFTRDDGRSSGSLEMAKESDGCHSGTYATVSSTGPVKLGLIRKSVVLIDPVKESDGHKHRSHHGYHHHHRSEPMISSGHLITKKAPAAHGSNWIWLNPRRPVKGALIDSAIGSRKVRQERVKEEKRRTSVHQPKATTPEISPMPKAKTYVESFIQSMMLMKMGVNVVILRNKSFTDCNVCRQNKSNRKYAIRHIHYYSDEQHHVDPYDGKMDQCSTCGHEGIEVYMICGYCHEGYSCRKECLADHLKDCPAFKKEIKKAKMTRQASLNSFDHDDDEASGRSDFEKSDASLEL